MALKFLSPIHNASRQIGLYLEVRCAEMALSTTESHLLSYLRSYSPAPVSELHRVFGTKRSTLTSIFDRLEERGWVTRSPSKRDRRVVLIDLTDQGRKRADAVQESVEQLESGINRAITPGELQGFIAVMSAITAVTEITVVDRGAGLDPAIT
jgi:DNA-binding MarR family transcriptional regulator